MSNRNIISNTLLNSYLYMSLFGHKGTKNIDLANYKHIYLIS
jgi:hypothetical protein